jgi:two-component system, chemotaxis family, chemotaxis protein CheY
MTGPRTILVLEDSAMMQSLYRMVLEQAGTRLIFAGDGVEGLDRASAERDIDLFIVDVNLPRLDGISFIRRLRSELRADAPVVVVSTECADEDRAVATEAGADAYLCKPWTPEQLHGVIGALRERA